MGTKRARRSRRGLALAAALAASPAAVAGETDDTIRGTIRIEVTGSHIFRTDVETALPVQVISREDIERGGFTTVAALMSSVSANIGAFTDARSVGSTIDQFPRPGLSSVNLRGIGDGSTLVLINGRRVANYAFDGGAVDVNSLPLSAIDRVEILKDGASAIYGTDAIAGVVNFIMRKDYRGADVSAQGNWTQHGGGNQFLATATAGAGDLARDRYNAFVTVNWQEEKALRPTDRSFLSSGFRDDVPPEAWVFTRWTFPANVAPGGRVLLNPAYETGCTPPSSRPWPTGAPACAYDAPRYFDVLPAATRAGAYGRATFAATPGVELFAEAGYVYNKLTLTGPPTAAGSIPPDLFFYPEGGPFYPAAFAAANGLSGDLNLVWRTEPLGGRVNDIETQALRAVLGMQGAAGGWDYGAGIAYTGNRESDDLVSGYVSARGLNRALATGLVNPFGLSGPEGDALLRSAAVSGPFRNASGSTWLVDGRASRDLVRLAGGPLGLALGGEARGERLTSTYSALATGGDVLNTGGDHASVSASRDAQALYAEASVPFAAGVESQFALRYDHYSDFGGTVNPKIALRWQPVQSVLLRGSWGTGFRAPTLYDLYMPLSATYTNPDFADPVRCPVTQDAYDCGGEFPAVIGGNPNLQPETSSQYNLGVVWSPTPAFSMTVDYWNIEKKNLIGPIDERDTLVPDARFASNVLRGPVDPAYPDLPGPIRTVVLWNENLGTLRTSGFDVGLKWRSPASSVGRFTFGLDGTYVDTYTIALSDATLPLLGTNDGPYAIPRWRHYATIGWEYGPWSATLAQTFQSGYREQDFAHCDDQGCASRSVGTYSVWNVQGRYAGWKSLTLTAGVNNLMDSTPPLVYWQPGRQAWFDAAYADPRGRTFYARIDYAFP